MHTKNVGSSKISFFSQLFNRYTPKPKDWVHINAIESDAGGPELIWRAVSVFPNSMNSKSFESSVGSTKVDQEYLQDTSEITVERKSNFGTMVVGSFKHLSIEIRNISPRHQTLISAKFANHKGNFELQNQICPVVIPSEETIAITVTFK